MRGELEPHVDHLIRVALLSPAREERLLLRVQVDMRLDAARVVSAMAEEAVDATLRRERGRHLRAQPSWLR